MKYLTLMCAFLALAVSTAISAEKPLKFAANAQLHDAQGKSVGTASLKQTKAGVKITLHVTGLPAGTHAFHIHDVGKCEAPDFKSAGGHFNPESKKHGLKNPEGPHAGDMPNVNVGANGKGKASVVNTRITLAEGANSVYHEGGARRW